MKKIGKNTKLYLIGMIIGGITLGITTVIADTIINSTSVAYKTTTVKAAIDELYGLADLKPRVDTLESYFKNNPTSLFDGPAVEVGKYSEGIGVIRLFKSGKLAGKIYPSTELQGLTLSGTNEDDSDFGGLYLKGKGVYIGDTLFEDMFFLRWKDGSDLVIPAGGAMETEYTIGESGAIPIMMNCTAKNSATNGTGLSYINIYLEDLNKTQNKVSLKMRNYGNSIAKVTPSCEILYVRTTTW